MLYVQFVHDGTYETNNAESVDTVDCVATMSVCACACILFSRFAHWSKLSSVYFISFIFSLEINKTDNLRGGIVVARIIIKMKRFSLSFLNINFPIIIF